MKRTGSTRPLRGDAAGLGCATDDLPLRTDMKKLISAMTVIVLSVGTVSTAAAGQGAMGRAAREARARDRAEARDQADRPPHKKGPKAIKREARRHRRDVK